MNVKLIDIYKIFFKIGAILLGGGYVIIPIMQSELVEKKNWLNEQELCDYYCVSQCLPGIIAINMSILVGYKLSKFKGAIASILGIITSPIIAILIIANLLDKIMHIPFIDGVFWGVNLSVIVLIYLALKEMWQKSIIDYLTTFWFILILVLSLLKISPAILIISSIVFGVILHVLKRGKNA